MQSRFSLTMSKGKEWVRGSEFVQIRPDKHLPHRFSLRCCFSTSAFRFSLLSSLPSTNRNNAMTNPQATMRMLITYVISIAAAIFVGYLLTNPLDYGTLGFLGLILLVIISPVFIKWHYPIMIFGLGCPMVCFFLVGSPPLAQVVVLMSLGIAIVERAINSDQRFISAPVMVWPLLFIAGMALVTAKLTGGVGLHALGGGTGGGKKYIALFVGVATFFALTSHRIPRSKWKWYLALYLLSSLLGVVSDFFPFLPSPLNVINLLFPPNQNFDEGVVVGTTRLRAFAFAFGVIPIYLLARYGLQGIFGTGKLWRPVVFVTFAALSLLGGFRITVIGLGMICFLMFFLEGLHRTRLMPLLVMAGVLGGLMLAVFSNKLPYTFQRSLSFLPFKWKSEVVLDAQGSSEWRYNIWRATWPKVPEYLLLGKGYALSEEDYQNIGAGTFVNFSASHIDASEEALAISGDYHSGPLSTLMPFGIWGAIGILWLMAATVFVLYRNYRYGDPELHIFNTFLLASGTSSIIFFFFIFGAFQNDVGNFAKLAGFSLAMNWGVAKRPARATSNPMIKPLSPLPAPQMTRGMS